MKLRIALIMLSLTVGKAISQELITYEIPRQYKYAIHNDDFTVLARVPGGEWKDLYEYRVEVDMDTKSKASMVYFDFEGKVEVMVKKNNGSLDQVKIRPLAKNIVPDVKENTMLFSLDKPMKLSLEVNGDRLHNLHIFANAIDRNKPDLNDPNVIYFGPGVHQPGDLPGDVFNISSGKTVYVDGGAIVKAKFLVDKAHDVKILGRGIVLQPERGVEIRHSKNVTVDGLIFINPKHYTIYGGESTELTIRNIKSFSSEGWSDGIDLMSCSNVEIDDVFMRNSDDCIAIYGHRWDFYGDARNYDIKNSILWADVAHPTNIGVHGDAEHDGNIIENIKFSNIDILEHDEDDVSAEGCMAISVSDNNTARSISYTDIRIESIQEGRIFNFVVFFSEKYSAASGRKIENITIKNITYNGPYVNPSIIKGYNSERNVEGITIENLKINGKLVTNPKEGNIHIGDFATKITFKK